MDSTAAISISPTLSAESWAQEAIQTLSLIQQLDPAFPALLLLRHSQRQPITKKEEVSNAPLTASGRKVAHAFGLSLPTDREYHIYSSPVTRCRESAKLMVEGIQAMGGSVQDHGAIDVLHYLVNSSGESDALIERDLYNFLNRWLAGFYPPNIAMTSLAYSQLAAKVMVDSTGFSRSTTISDPRRLDIFVTHDFNILTLRFHWCGINPGNPPEDWWDFLQGCYLQFTPTSIVNLDKLKQQANPYPHWWPTAMDK